MKTLKKAKQIDIVLFIVMLIYILKFVEVFNLFIQFCQIIKSRDNSKLPVDMEKAFYQSCNYNSKSNVKPTENFCLGKFFPRAKRSQASRPFVLGQMSENWTWLRWTLLGNGLWVIQQNVWSLALLLSILWSKFGFW